MLIKLYDSLKIYIVLNFNVYLLVTYGKRCYVWNAVFVRITILILKFVAGNLNLNLTRTGDHQGDESCLC